MRNHLPDKGDKRTGKTRTQPIAIASRRGRMASVTGTAGPAGLLWRVRAACCWQVTGIEVTVSQDAAGLN